jgi:aryl-alcohol dehydrogenase-like predicted oxidoreductase
MVRDRPKVPPVAAYPRRMELRPRSRQLGSTGLSVSALGVGLAALGRPGYINLGHDRDFPGGRSVEAMRDATFAVLDAARAAGVRYVDAARSYGRAEEFLAAWLAARGIRPEELAIGSKWGYTYVADWQTDAAVHEVKDHSLATLQRQVAESTELLGRHLDLLQVHSATLDSGILDSPPVLDALVGLRRDGVVRAIGLTLSGTAQAQTLRVATGVVRQGERVFDTVQATFNVLERSAGEALSEAHAQGMGVLVKEALANGRLVLGAAAERIRPLANRLETRVDAVALRFVLDQPWADVTLLGPATVAQLGSNLLAEDLRLDADARSVLEGLREDPARYWDHRSHLPWH